MQPLWKAANGVGSGLTEESAMLELLMRPANAVCNAMQITDEHERGMVRMLVNMLLLSLAGMVGFVMVAGSF
jgi:hypothetical protein